jgi:hypothetical protein
VSNATLVGFAKFAQTNDLKIHKLTLIGSTTLHHGSGFGVSGVYIDGWWSNTIKCGQSGSGACGGNKWDVLTLSFENGIADWFGDLDLFDNVVYDTTRDYGVACIGCNTSSFSSVWSTFTGLNPSGGQAYEGVGMYFGSSAINNRLGGLYTVGNAIDLHLGDSVSSVWVENLSWATSKNISGSTTSLYPTYKIASIATLSISSATSPVYLAPGTASSTQTVGVISGINGTITSFFVSTGAAPSSATYQAFLFISRWNAGAGTYGSWTSYASCSYTGALQGCLFPGPGVTIGPEDQIQLEFAIQGGGTFPSGQTVTATIGGI